MDFVGLDAAVTLIAMFDNSMPMSYSTIRSKHTTFLAHTQTICQAPLAHNSFVPSATNGGDKDVKGDGGHDKGPCTRCGKKGHNKIKWFKPKTEYHLCGADHLTAFCINAKGNHRRAELTVSSLETIVKERDEALKFVTPPPTKQVAPLPTWRAQARLRRCCCSCAPPRPTQTKPPQLTPLASAPLATSDCPSLFFVPRARTRARRGCSRAL